MTDTQKENNHGEMLGKSVINWTLKNKEWITFLMGMVAVMYPVVNALFKVVYQKKCEEFYDLPGEYFSQSVDKRIIYLVVIVLFMLLILYPSRIYRKTKSSGKASKGDLFEAGMLSVALGLELGIINCLNLITIMKQTYNANGFFTSINMVLNQYAFITIGIVVGCGTFSVVGLTFAELINDTTYKWMKKIMFGIFLVSFVISFTIMVYGSIFNMSISIDKKTKYEFLTVDNSEYVILSQEEDKLLVVSYKVDTKGRYSFYTDKYYFVNEYEGTFEYRDIGESPIIHN